MGVFKFWTILAALVIGYSIFPGVTNGAMQFSLQLNNYTNPAYQVVNPVATTHGKTYNTTCLYKIGNLVQNGCNFHFTTIITFPNATPFVVSTLVFAPPDNTSYIYFNNTLPVSGSSPTSCYTGSNALLNCTDVTWQQPHSKVANQMPLSIEVIVHHFGNVGYDGTLVSMLMPSTLWYVDTFYVNLRNFTTTGSTIPAINNSVVLAGKQNTASSLGLTLSMQCTGGWSGPECLFSNCAVLQQGNGNDINGTYMCQTTSQNDYKWICQNNTVYANPSNCVYCPNGIAGLSCRPLGEAGPTVYKSSTGLTAGIIVLAIIALIELIIIIAAIVYINKQKKATHPPPSNVRGPGPALQTNVKQTNGNQRGRGKYTPAPVTDDRDSDWPILEREYNPADEYSTPHRNGSNRQEAAV